MENRYWNQNGAAQAHYDEMEAAGFEYTQATYRSMHSYYRYYNDGDLPGWARSRWEHRTHQLLSFPQAQRGWRRRTGAPGYRED